MMMCIWISSIQLASPEPCGRSDPDLLLGTGFASSIILNKLDLYGYTI